MFENIVRIYMALFANKFYVKFNKFLFGFDLGGLGVLNYKTSTISVEHSFLKNCLPNKKGVLLDVGTNEGGYSFEAKSFKCNMTIPIAIF